MAAPETRSRLHWWILIGLALGAIVGGTVNYFVSPPPVPHWLHILIKYVTAPIGEIFLRLLLLTVIPLVFASLALGVLRLGDLSKIGRMGVKTLGYFLITMTVAVTIGLALVNTVRPGSSIDPETREQLMSTYQSQGEEKLQSEGFGIHTIVDIVPRNPFQAAVDLKMLSIIFLALLVGIALTRMPEEKTRTFRELLETIGDITIWIIGLAMRIAPVGVFCLIFTTTAQFGFSLLQSLGWYVFVVILGLLIQLLVTYPILLTTLARVNPWAFFKAVRAPMVTAFSTSSSNATLPTSIKTAEEELMVPKPIAGFVLPLGATMNMNGTALFEGVTAVFLAQVFGAQLGLVDQLIVVVICVLTAVGAAGVPGGSIPLLAMVLVSVNVPPEAIFLILGVDRILDMCRTTLNVTGDLTATVFIARTEQVPTENPLAQDPVPPPPPGAGTSGSSSSPTTSG